MDVPPLCIIEASIQNWDDAWAQALAEMYAASTQGATMCYAAVTSGDLWQFGQFDKKDSLFIKDRNKIYIIDEPPATDQLQKLFNTLESKALALGAVIQSRAERATRVTRNPPSS